MAYCDGFASVYDAFTMDVDYSAQADFVLNVMQNAGLSCKTVLDLACGTGSLTEELAERGCEVIGVDISDEMLSEAREKCVRFGENVLLLCQDMCELDLFGTVDCAVCALDSLNHLDGIESVRKAAERVFLFLEPGGVFVFDVNTVYKHREVLGDNTFVRETGSSFLVWQNELRGDGVTVDMYIDVFTQRPDGTYSRECEDITEKAYERETLEKLLGDVGFESINVYGEYGEKTIKADEQRLRFTAVKPISYKEQMQNG